MVPLKMQMRLRYVILAADQVSALYSVDVESPKQLSPHASAALGPSPLSFHTSSAPTSSSIDAVVSHCQRRALWRHRVEDCLWLASAFFILYYGDFRSDFFTLVTNDVRVWRTPLHMGLACLMLDCCMGVLYIAMSMQALEAERRRSQAASGVIPAVIMLGSLAFTLMSIALWPIWNFLTIPMLFTLLMAFMVVVPYILGPCMKVKFDMECASYLDGSSSCEHEKMSTS